MAEGNFYSGALLSVYNLCSTTTYTNQSPSWPESKRRIYPERENGGYFCAVEEDVEDILDLEAAASSRVSGG